MSKPENNSIGVSKVSLPKGGGAIKEIGDTFSPNSFTGTGSFSIPFPVTKARGSKPNLSFNYNSGSGNGSFGLGFSLSISKISLKTSLGIPKYEGKETYILNGDKLVKNGHVPPKNESNDIVTEYLQRVEGSFSLIKHYVASDKSGCYREVITTKNHTSIFGKTQAPQSPHFNELTINGNLPISNYLNADGFMPVGLNQEGISRLLHNNNALAYLESEGEGITLFLKHKN